MYEGRTVVIYIIKEKQYKYIYIDGFLWEMWHDNLL